MSLWLRIRGAVARLFRGREPAPGRFVAGRNFSWSGTLRGSPWTWPSREYLVYIPRGYSRWKRRPLLVLLHGCRQTPEVIAQGTRIAAIADRHGWLVLLPRQPAAANPWSCWNWFDARTARGSGEAAIVVAQIDSTRRTYRADPRRIFVAGMSAGGAMAAVMGVQHSALFSGVIVHSGLACGAASSPMKAFDVMTQGADGPYEQIAVAARAKNRGKIVPLLAIQGESDDVVANINAVQVVRQFLLLNGRIEPGAKPGTGLPKADVETTLTPPDGHRASVDEYRVGTRTAARLVRVSELAHAWSGGDAALPYNDPQPPDASAMLADFIIEQIRAQRRPRFRRP
ncbi:MAG: PHB depolymerase family esterase [Betaproteobacteria bacterium]